MKFENKEFLIKEKNPDPNVDPTNFKSSEILNNNVFSVSSNQKYTNYLI